MDTDKNDMVISIEQLVAKSIFLEASDIDEFDDFVESLMRTQRSAEKNLCVHLCEIFDVLLKVLKEKKPAACDAVREGLRCVQGILSECSLDDISDAHVTRVKYVVDPHAYAGDALNAVALSDGQREEIPTFIEDAECAFLEIEKNLLEIDSSGVTEEIVDTLFRHFHTVKGESGLVGFVQASKLLHYIEDFFAQVKREERSIEKEDVDQIFAALDVCKMLIATLKQDIDEALSIDVSEACNALVSLVERGAKKVSEAGHRQDGGPERDKKNIHAERYVSRVPQINLSEGLDIIFEFIEEGKEHLTAAEDALLVLEKQPEDEESLNKVFRAFHTIKGVAGFIDLTDIQKLTHETETMIDCVRQGTIPMSAEVTDAVLESIDMTRKMLSLLQEQTENNGVLQSEYVDIGDLLMLVQSLARGGVPQKKPLGEIMIEDHIVTAGEVGIAVEAQEHEMKGKKIGEILIEQESATPRQVERSLQMQKKGAVAEESIKIATTKLDQLIDMVGELVIVGTQIYQDDAVVDAGNEQLFRNVALLEKIIRDIQDNTMSMRLVPVRPIFQKMQRLVRDLSRKSQKDIEVKLTGEDTEIDKSIIDLIGDPLMHMVRNSVDHGVESAEVRAERGKSATGRIGLDAFHEGGNIVIELCDDGGGLNKDKILRKAIAAGLTTEHEALPDNRIYNMIFEPGFSTAEKVTDISGRGVGMDVVRRNIEMLRGKIDIYSEEKKGTTFSIKLPLTLAIIDGIVARVSNERFIIPIFSVIEFIKPDSKLFTTVVGKGVMISVHKNLYNVVRLDEQFDIQSSNNDLESMTGCLVESDRGPICLFVDELLGQQQVVIKNLGERLRNIRGVSGGTILGDGKVGLILDINGLVSLVRD